MIARSLLLAAALFAVGTAAATAQTAEAELPTIQSGKADVLMRPVLRANVSVTDDLVRIGDVIDNAGSAALIAIYRAPDLGTTGSLPTASVLAALRAHQVIGVETNDIREISVTRLSRTLRGKEIEQQIANALANHNGLGDAENLVLTFYRDVQTLQLDAANSGAMRPADVNYQSRNGRFDVSFVIAGEPGTQPARLRYSGTVVETVEAAVLARAVERNEIIKASDVVIERRPKAEVPKDAAGRDQAVGMQARRQLRSGAALRIADLVKPDLVSRDQSVTLTYQAVGLYLTVRGKA
ncbi:flagellar basal body P-ring formation chaperone FlgA, partial [Rhodopseudomonas palustris]